MKIKLEKRATVASEHDFDAEKAVVITSRDDGSELGDAKGGDFEFEEQTVLERKR